MPLCAPRPCRHAGCHALARDGSGYCPAHQADKKIGRFADPRRGSSADRGYGAIWRELREIIMCRDCGLCHACKEAGRVTLATHVDHIVPKCEGGDDDESNLRAICTTCHKTKTASESQRAKGGGRGGDMTDAIQQFRAALAARGICPEQVDGDGRLHRCAVEGSKAGRKDGSYVLHLDGLPAGGFDNWRDGLGWQNWRATPDHEPTHEERAAWRAQAEAVKQQRQLDESERHAAAAKRATKLLSQCKPATNDHAYLVRKGVNAYGLKQLREQIVIPARDIRGVLWTLQFIQPDGQKIFLTGGRKRGCYFAVGVPRELLCICEGYATAASVYEATGHATAVAFDAGNLEPVARALRTKFPDLTLIVCADNDSQTPGNPGVTRAVEAARAVRGLVAIPQFGGGLS